MTARILIIDNYEAMRKMLTLTLQRRGYEVFSYDYPSLDLAALHHLRPDLIILDFNVRDEEVGWEFLQLLKMDDATINIPILITTTALHLSAEVQGYLAAHYIRVLTKPFDFTAMLILVQNTLTLAGQAGMHYLSNPLLPILLIEDSEALRDIITTVLRLEGYQVAIADNGRLALDTLYSADFSLILLDIQMPVMDGFEFLKIYSQQLRPHTPVLILTGEGNIRTKILPSFVINVLLKPFEVRDLLRMVEVYAQPT